MVDFFANLNNKIVQPILANVADKAGELQDNGEVDLPVLQNIAGQLGISEEKYEKIEDGLFGLADSVLSAAAPIIDKVAPVADQVFDMLLQSLGNGSLTAVSTPKNTENKEAATLTTNNTTSETTNDEAITTKSTDTKAVFNKDSRIKTNTDGSSYVTVEPWSNDSSANNCLERIVANSYDLEAMGIEKNSPEYNQLLEQVMDANPDIYGTKEGGWRSEVGGSGRVNAVIHDGEKIVLPGLVKTENNSETAPAATTSDSVTTAATTIEETNSKLLSDTELTQKINSINSCIDADNYQEFQKIWNEMSPEQQAQVMKQYDGEFLLKISRFPMMFNEKQVLLNGITANVAKTENGSKILAKELLTLFNSDEVPDAAAPHSILTNKAISSETTLKIMKEYNKLVNPYSDPEGRSLIDDICQTKNLLQGDKLDILRSLSVDVQEQSVATGNSYSTEKDKIAKAIAIVDDFIKSI